MAIITIAFTVKSNNFRFRKGEKKCNLTAAFMKDFPLQCSYEGNDEDQSSSRKNEETGAQETCSRPRQ